MKNVYKARNVFMVDRTEGKLKEQKENVTMDKDDSITATIQSRPSNLSQKSLSANISKLYSTSDQVDILTPTHLAALSS